jgi:RHS repeat-associated protein
MTDWDSNVSTFAYDQTNRHIATMRQDGFRSHYQYDASGRLKRLRHHDGSQTLADFLYEVDALGNRTKATELLRQSGATMSTTTIAHDDTDIEYSGTWSAVGGFHETTQIGATLRLEFLGNTDVELTMGEGDDHSIYDVYVNETLWQSYDGYASASGERVIEIPLMNDGINVLEVRNTMDVNSGSSGRKVRFKQLSVDSDVTMQTITYDYDALSRLLEADYSNDRNYQYQYDLAGNRTQQQTTIGITTTTTDWTYNDANQMSTMKIGANPLVNMSFDANGNLTDDGILTYTWDRANRLKTHNNGTYNTHFAYDGNGDRHQQNVGGTITNYLLDVQPELALVLGETVGATTTSYIHAPMGVHSAYDGTNWTDMLQDGLGSVRAQVDATGAVVADQWYDPYGQVIDDNGTWVGSFGYAGEQTDESGLGYNRARYYNPAMGAFASLDPFEGIHNRPMSMNGYSYAENNPTNWTDPSGEFVNIIAGAIGGAVIGGAIGAILGTTQAEMTYYLAASGRCKCSHQEQAIKMGYTNFVQEFKQQGLIFGATFGAIFGAGGPLATVMGGVLSALGIAQSAETVIRLFEDFIQDGRIDNECLWVDFAFDLLDVIAGKVGQVRGRKGRKPRTPKNKNSHNPPINRLPDNSNGGSRVRTARRIGAENQVSLRKRRKWYGNDGKPNLNQTYSNVNNRTPRDEVQMLPGFDVSAGGSLNKTSRLNEIPAHGKDWDWQSNSGDTLGILQVSDRNDVYLRSGSGPYQEYAGDLPSNVVGGRGSGFDNYTRTHVEGHSAIIMHKESITEADLYINFVNGPCQNCNNNLASMLPTGATLNVYYPTSSGTVSVKTYIGN